MGLAAGIRLRWGDQPRRHRRRWLPAPAIVDSPSADTPASDTGSGGDGLSGRLTTLRVHYPPPAGKNLSARGSLAPLSWSSGATMTRKSADVFELTIRDLRVPSGGA